MMLPNKPAPSYNQLMKQNKWLFAITLFLSVFFLVLFIAGLYFYQYHYKSSSGVFFPGPNVILIKESPTVYSMLYAAEHEIGHNVYYTYLNQTQRDEWRFISESSSADEYITPYARTSVEEDFAESFASRFICHIDTNRLRVISEQKANWFANNNYTLKVQQR